MLGLADFSKSLRSKRSGKAASESYLSKWVSILNIDFPAVNLGVSHLKTSEWM